MNEVYIIRFNSTGETFETTVCANMHTAQSILESRGYNKRIGEGLNWWVYQERDDSQTAEIVQHNVFDFGEAFKNTPKPAE